MQPAKRGRATFLPRLERLDDRIVPAGALRTTFAPATGTLTITAVPSNDPAMNDQSIALLGASLGHVSISAQNGTTIVGRNSFNNVRTLVANMNGGNDTVTIVDLKLARRFDLVRFNMGSGDNRVQFDGEKIDIGNLIVTNGVGKLTATPISPVQQHYGSIGINALFGPCDLLIGGLTVDRTTTIVTGNVDNDVVRIDDATFKGNFLLMAGGGNDVVEMGQIEPQPEDKEEVIFNAACAVNLGAGYDVFSAGPNYHAYDTPPNHVRWRGRGVVFDGGLGNDTIDVFHRRATEFVVAGNPVVERFETIVYTT